MKNFGRMYITVTFAATAAFIGTSARATESAPPQQDAALSSTSANGQAQYDQGHIRYTTHMAKSHKFYQGTEGPRVRFRHIRPTLEQSDEARKALKGYTTKRVFENTFKVVGIVTVLTFLGMNLADAVGLVPLAIGAGSGALVLCLSVPLMVSANKDQAEAVDAYNRYFRNQLGLPETAASTQFQQTAAALPSRSFKLSYTWTF